MQAELPPRLLHVFPSFVVGGAQMRFSAIANHFGDAFSHSIIAMDGRTDARDLLDPAVPVDYLSLETRAGSMPARIGRFAAVLRDVQPHRLITSNWGSIDWAFARALTGTPHVHMEDGFGPEERDRQLPRRALTRRAILRRSDIILPSRTLLHIAQTMWRLSESHMHYIPNGIDLGRFRPRTEPRGETPVIGTVAALRAEKNLSRLLQAFAIVYAQREARLVIVGDGAERPRLQRQAAELGIAEHVEFAGHTKTPELYYKRFDVFALSSDTEQMPLAILEAMAVGLPVASTDVGDVSSMLSPENAPYVVTKSAEALAAAVLALLSDPVQIGPSNRRRAEAYFSDTAMFQAHALLWRKKAVLF
jgi:glycosyltransferase involved in cell wall biosynthesis